MVKTFEQIKRRVLSLNNSPEELERINEELDLFNKRGWNEYIALAINIINEVEDKVKLCFTGLSILDSLFVLKATREDKYIPHNFVNKKRPKEILFNDAFRFLTVVRPSTVPVIIAVFNPYFSLTWVLT